MTKEEIYRARIALGLSQSAFARMVGTTRETVNRWERDGQRPSLMARALIRTFLASRGVFPDVAA